jgi:hypothetical protein
MEWIEKYSDFDELQKSRLAIFFKENRSVQLLKQTLYWLNWGLSLTLLFAGIALKEWAMAGLFFLFLGNRLINRKTMKSRYLTILGMAMFLMASFLVMLHFIQQQS